MVIRLLCSLHRTPQKPVAGAVLLSVIVATLARANGQDLPLLNGSVLALEERPASQAAGGWPSRDTGQTSVIITVESTPCSRDGYCVCRTVVPASCEADSDYRSLGKLLQRLGEADEHASGPLARQLADQQAELLRNLENLQKRLSQQSPSASMSELNGHRKELDRLSSLVEQLGQALASSTAAADAHKELEAIAKALAALESRNPEAVQSKMQDEIGALRDRLERCSSDSDPSKQGATGGSLAGRSTTPFPGDYLPYSEPYGKCPSSHKIFVGPEVTHRHRNSASWWGKDARPKDNAARSAIYEIRETASSSSTVLSWTNYADFSSSDAEQLARRSGCTFPIHGRKNVIVGGYLFFAEAWSQRAVWRLQLSTCSTEQLPLTLETAEYNLYAHNESTYVDLNYDETGLYAVYGDAANSGRLVIAKIDPDDLTLLAAWTTSRMKSSVANVFFTCGRMYATDTSAAAHLSGRQYGFDTATGKEFYVDGLDVESRFGGVRQLSYNPRERLIFGFDNQHLVTYRLSLGG